MRDGRTPEDEHLERLRDGVRAGILRRGARRLRHATPTAAIAALAAGAFGPVIASALGATGVADSAIDVLGSVGANILTEELRRGVDALRAEGADVPAETAEAAFAARLERALDRDDAYAAELRREIAVVLDRIDAVGTALTAAAEARDDALLDLLGDEFARVSETFGEFGRLLTRAHDSAVAAREAVLRQELAHRATVEAERHRSMILQRVLELTTDIERRTRLPTVDGRSVSADLWRGCPYPGLESFAAADSRIFYGREALTTKVVSAVARTSRDLIMVTGASGAGKSSLLRAGFLAAVQRGDFRPGSQTWPAFVMTPGQAPFDELAIQLAAQGSGVDAPATAVSLRAAPSRANLTARQILTARGPSRHAEPPRFVIVVDQFEELFSAAFEHTEEDRAGFVEALCSLAGADAHDGPAAAYVVVAVRGDYWDRCSEYAGLARAQGRDPVVVEAMSELELRRALIGPASAAGLRLDEGLADTVLADLRVRRADPGARTGALPLLSQAMAMTWQERQEDRLTLHGYDRVGGVGGAVRAAAEGVWDALGSDRRAIAEALFRQLTAVAGEDAFERRRLGRDELEAAGVLDPHVLDAFVGARLLSIDRDTVEIVHDVLYQAWPRLQTWLAADVADAVLHRQVDQRAKEWADGHPESALYRGDQLADVEAAARRWGADAGRYRQLSVAAVRLIEASRRAAGRRRRIRRAVVASGVTLTLLAVGAAVLAQRATLDTARQRDRAVAQQLVLQAPVLTTAEPAVARRLAAGAARLYPGDSTRATMLSLLADPARQVLSSGPRAVNGVAVTRDGRTVVAAGGDGDVTVWDVAALRPAARRLSGHRGPVMSVAISPDQQTAASGGRDGTVRLWDLATGRALGEPLTGHKEDVLSLDFRPDGHLLASAGRDGAVRLWDPATRAAYGEPLTEAAGPVLRVLFTPAGDRLIASSTDDRIRVYEVSSRKEAVEPLRGSEAWNYDLVLSPSGTALLAVGAGGTVTVRDPSTAVELGEFETGHTPITTAIAMSPDGAVTATAGEDHLIRLWDTSIRAYRILGEPLTGHTATVSDLAFGAEGRTLISSGNDGTIRTWDLSGRAPALRPGEQHPHEQGFWFSNGRLGTGAGLVLTDGGAGPGLTAPDGDDAQPRWLSAPSDGLVALAVSQDNRLVAASSQQFVTVWDGTTRRPLHRIATGHLRPVSAATFSPDGRLLATGSQDGTIRFFDVASGAPAGAPMTGHSNLVSALAFSPGGDLLASAGYDRTIRLWDTATRAMKSGPLLGHTDAVEAVAFTADGKTLASAGDDHSVRLWDVGSGTAIARPLGGNNARVTRIAFNSHGTLLAAVVQDDADTVRLWDVASGTSVADLPTDGAVDVVFTDGDEFVVVLNDYAEVRWWDVRAYRNPASAICAFDGPPTAAEWTRFVASAPLPQVCR